MEQTQGGELERLVETAAKQLKELVPTLARIFADARALESRHARVQLENEALRNDNEAKAQEIDRLETELSKLSIVLEGNPTLGAGRGGGTPHPRSAVDHFFADLADALNGK